MVFIRTAATFLALIFSTQFAIASGPALLEETREGRAVVSTRSKGWGISSWIQDKITSFFAVPEKREPSWQDQWDAIAKHMQKMVLDHHQGGFWAAEGIAKMDKLTSLTPDELDQLKKRLASGADLLDDGNKDLADKVDYLENKDLLDDIKTLKMGEGVALLYRLSRSQDTFPQFIDVLSRFYQSISDRNEPLKDEKFFSDGALMAHCLWGITKMSREEEQLPTLQKQVLDFYTAYDGKKLSTSSKRTLDALGIPYSTDVMPKAYKPSATWGELVTGGGICFLILAGGFVQGVAAQTPTMLTTACRGTAIECLSAFGSPVGFGTPIANITGMQGYGYTLGYMQEGTVALAYGDTRGAVNSFGTTYAEVSSWNNGISPNVTRVLNSNIETGFMGVVYQPYSSTQHTETAFTNTPIAPLNPTTTTASGSINPYSWELQLSGDLWLLMVQMTDGNVLGSIVFRPVSGTPYQQSYANLVMTSQRVANRVQPSALQGIYVPSSTPARVTSQQASSITADQFWASVSTSSVATSDCSGSQTMAQFLAANNISFSTIISCLQNSGYNPLSCRPNLNPLGTNGYVQLMTYYMQGGLLHEAVVSGSGYTHDIYNATGSSSMSRTRHTFTWNNQGAPTTATTTVAQSLSSRQGTLLTSGAPRKFGVFYYGGTDTQEPAIVIKVDETGAVTYGTYFGSNKCGNKRSDEQQSKAREFVEKRSEVDIPKVKAQQAQKRSWSDAISSFFGYHPEMIQPHADMTAEQWYQFREQFGSVVNNGDGEGTLMKRFQFSDGGRDHDVHFKVDGSKFEVTHLYQNSSTGFNPNQKKWIAH